MHSKDPKTFVRNRGFGNRRGRGGPRGGARPNYGSDTNFSKLGGSADLNETESEKGGENRRGRSRGDFERGFRKRGGRGNFERGNRRGRGHSPRGYGNPRGRGDFGNRGGRGGFGNRRGRGDSERGYGNRRGRGDSERGYGNRRGRGDSERGYGNRRGRGDSERGYGNRRGRGDSENGAAGRGYFQRGTCDQNYDYGEWDDGVTEVLDEDTRNYFSRVLERLQTGEGFESKDDEEIFVTNVLAQTDGKEVMISCNKLGSQCLQRLLQLPNTKAVSVLKFASKFSKDMVYICTHHFASHVVQSTLNASFQIIQNNYKGSDVDNDSSSISELISWLISVGQVCLENLDDFLHNLYASHVVSTVLQVFGGHTIDENIVRSKRSRNYNRKRTISETGEEITNRPISKPKENVNVVSQVPEECAEMLKKISKEFCKQDLHDLATNQCASPVIQVVLLITQKNRPKVCQKIVKAILKQVIALSEEGKLSTFLTNDISSHVMERVVTVADVKKRQFLWKNFFQGHLKELALNPKANFILQRFLSTVEDNEQLEAILNELGPCFQEIFEARFLGVVVSLGEACKRLKTGQAHFVKSIMSVLHCWEPEDRQIQIVPLILYMVPYEEFNENRDKITQDKFKMALNESGINYHGSLILQHILWFNKPQKFARSLLALDPVELRNIICDPKGSHVLEAFVNSNFVGDKLRDKMIHILRPELVHIACNKYGSRIVDALWDASSLKQKNTIAEELSKKELLMFADRYGQYVAKKTALSHFKHRRKDWEQALTSGNKKRKLFEDIVGNVNTKAQ